MSDSDLETIKRAADQAIDDHCDEIVAVSDHIMHNPESGFREYETARFVQERFEAMGLDFVSGLALTGVKARMEGRRRKATVAVLGELDSLIIPEHPLADPRTGAAHACGHNAQIASMIGAAYGLRGVMDKLDGDVVLMAVPAEEGIELDWRRSLRNEGQIEFLVGKAELLRIGAFDDIDIAMLTHTAHGEEFLAGVGDTHNGCLFKRATFEGVSAHAGAHPWEGVNALKAACLGVLGLDAQRETFKDEDTVRIHPIMTRGGDAVSAVPSVAELDMFVRGRTMEAITDASRKVDRSLRAGAMALGAGVTIETTGGYMPNRQDPRLVELMSQSCARVVGEENVRSGRHIAASTDMGDLSLVMPVVQPRSGGTVGFPHSRDYVVTDHVRAAVLAAKFMAGTVIDLLGGGAQIAQGVLSKAGPKLSREAYVQYRRSLDSTTRIPLEGE